MSVRAVLGLGTNMGDQMGNIQKAISSISLLPGTNALKISDIYETSPVGYQDQPDFFNCAVLIETGLSPQALLGACLGIEAAMGRVRKLKNGPRLIDIDLLLMEGAVCHEQELTLPHPRIGERKFVLLPLSDLFPNGMALGFSIPVIKAPEQKIRKIELPSLFCCIKTNIG